ncbi:MAG: stage II sporulation protein P [Lachnospiraceae bacterium]|nr:stage II sporulation protein P [Lachnospiraceae bacterium]
MRRRWYYLKRLFRANRPLLFACAVFVAVFFVLIWARHGIAAGFQAWFHTYGVRAAGGLLEGWFPAAGQEERDGFKIWPAGKRLLFAWLDEPDESEIYSEDPAYERLLAEAWEKDRNAGHAGGKDPDSGALSGGRAGEDDAGRKPSGTDSPKGTGAKGSEKGDGQESKQKETDMDELPGREVITLKPAGSVVIREKLADYDYLMGTFYNVHPTTTADRTLMDAKKFLEMDFSLDEQAEGPQILIYHTHSQEEFADYPGNPEATIVGVGTYLAELLEEKGYRVLHDTSVYDIHDGKLDRSQAYTYALEGVMGLLQKYPSIEVVLDVHRDGVKEGTRLVTDVNGKQTARIMFFNGTSQTPDGPIEYLPNPNRESNLGFSFQLQLAAAEQFPGFTRKIYLKGLRYNQHVRARSALIEVGAQTNTYEEARNAMEPLAEMLYEVLGDMEKDAKPLESSASGESIGNAP